MVKPTAAITPPDRSKTEAQPLRSDGGSHSNQPWDSNLGSLLQFRSVIYLGTFISGGAALIFQVVWQRYLSFLVGSEARSISLVVAVFLFGLAAGYRFWGNITERQLSRKALLKIVGFVELGIAAYGLAFPHYFALIKELAYNGPDWLIFDLLLSALLLFVPTFLMGASIPVLTAAVPVDPDEVNYCHSRIYGVNTLGAFLGALIAGLYLVPTYGLAMSLVIGAVLEAIVGLVFIFNTLQGPSHKAEDIPLIPNTFGSGGIYLFVFTVGAVSIGLEVLFTRVVALTIGPSQVVFPIVVGVVILGLAIGSLSLRRTTMKASRVPYELIKLSAILAVLYLTVPFWPYWVSHVRVSLAVIPSNYVVYLFCVVAFVSIMLLPLMIPMGRLLPLGYALIDKNRDDYGKVCGRVYFCNTLGTVAGAVGIGYLLFLVFNLPALFKVSMAMLLVLAAVLSLRSRRRQLAMACLIGAAAGFLLPEWNRLSHVAGVYRYAGVRDFHFQGLFYIPPPGDELSVGLLRDDPSATIAAYSVKDIDSDIAGVPASKSIAVNGKSDGNTIGDYSNMVLAGMLPYLFSPRQSGINAAVVGLGTGMTAGALASLPDVQSVTTLEISRGVIQASPFFDDGDFNLSTNPKSHIIQTDAFRFFARGKQKFDIIASEPSNPWVVGVENLFTPEYYALADRALNDGGVLCQWIQMYSTTDEIFGSICANVSAQFEHVSLFIMGAQDVGIVASHEPFIHPHLQRRMEQAEVRRALFPMAIDDPAILTLLQAYETTQLLTVAQESGIRPHSVEFPWIGHAAAKAFFLRQSHNLNAEVLEEFGRHLEFSPERRAEFAA